MVAVMLGGGGGGGNRMPTSSFSQWKISLRLITPQPLTQQLLLIYITAILMTSYANNQYLTFSVTSEIISFEWPLFIFKG